MSNETTSDTAQQLQLLSEDSPAIAHELNEIFRWYSNQRRSRLSHRAAASKEGPSTRNDSALPAPARFTRKAKPVPSESKDVLSGAYSSSAFPSQSAGQSCNTCATKLEGAYYDAILWKLMHFDCADCCRMDMSEMEDMDEHLNAAS